MEPLIVLPTFTTTVNKMLTQILSRVSDIEDRLSLCTYYSHYLTLLNKMGKLLRTILIFFLYCNATLALSTKTNAIATLF